MKVKKLDKSFPLVALSLIAVGIVASLLAYNHTVQAATIISSDGRYAFAHGEVSLDLDWSTDFQAPLVRGPEGYSLDLFFEPIPAPMSLENPWNTIDNVKEINDEEFIFDSEKQFYDAISANGVLYVQDFARISENGELVDIREVKEGRNIWLSAYFAPKILFLVSIAFLCFAFAFALIASYKKGTITKRNVTLVRISAALLGLAILSHFFAKGIFLLGIFGSIFDEWFDWSTFLIGSVLPALFILSVVIGLTNIVTQHMSKSILMKEEIDGTV